MCQSAYLSTRCKNSFRRQEFFPQPSMTTRRKIFSSFFLLILSLADFWLPRTKFLDAAVPGKRNSIIILIYYSSSQNSTKWSRFFPGVKVVCSFLFEKPWTTNLIRGFYFLSETPALRLRYFRKKFPDLRTRSFHEKMVLMGYHATPRHATPRT